MVEAEEAMVEEAEAVEETDVIQCAWLKVTKPSSDLAV
jgi:hypothetical protein